MFYATKITIHLKIVKEYKKIIQRNWISSLSNLLYARTTFTARKVSSTIA